MGLVCGRYEDPNIGPICLSNWITLLPHVLLILILAPLLIALHLKHKPHTRLPHRLSLHNLRWILTAAIVITECFIIVEAGLSHYLGYNGSHVSQYVPATWGAFAAILCIYFYNYIETHHRVRWLIILLIYWCVCIGVHINNMMMSMRNHIQYEVARYHLTYVPVGLYAAMCILELVVIVKQRISPKNASKVADKDEHLGYVHPHECFLSRITWHWLNPLLVLGYKQPLQVEDLGNLPQSDLSEHNWKKFNDILNSEIDKSKTSEKRVSLWRCYWRMHWPLIIVGSCMQFVVCALYIVGPYLTDRIVQFVSREISGEGNRANTTAEYSISVSDFAENAYVLGFVIFLCLLLQQSIQNNVYYAFLREGVKLKGALQAVVFQKTLRLSTYVMNEGGLSQGQVVNHMTIDPMNIYLFYEKFPVIVAILPMVIACIGVMYIQQGYAVLIGCSVVLISCPTQYIVGIILGKTQEKILDKSDERMKKSNELLQSIKLLKLYAWETIFCRRIIHVRNQELKLLLRAAFLRIISIMITDGVPITGTLITFVAYPLLENKPLQAGKVFSVLALFNILSLILYMAPILINLLSHAWVSTKRLNTFLSQPEVAALPWKQQEVESHTKESQNGAVPTTDHSEPNHTTPMLQDVKFENSIQHNSGEPEKRISVTEDTDSNDEEKEALEGPKEVLIDIDNGSFSWDQEGGNLILKNINLKVEKGQFIMVVGAVGSGKSSLLSALLSEMTVVKGNLQWKQNLSVAYGAQSAWLMNTTFRENILFGRPMDHDLYEHIVELCALQPDIDMLANGDMTEIGEKGINLSGGQKQRISIARALYNDADVYLLDDPFSALDVHVGKHIFLKAIMDFLVEKHKTVILVTHQLQYLPHASKVVQLSNGEISHQGSWTDIQTLCPDLYKSWMSAVNQSRKHQSPRSRQHSECERPLSPTRHINIPLDCRKVETAAPVSLIGPRAASSIQSLTKSLQNFTEEMMLFDDTPNPDEPHPAEEDEKGQLIADEERELGAVSLQVYWFYIKAAGLGWVIFTLLGYIVRQAARMTTDYWLAMWADAGQFYYNTTLNITMQEDYKESPELLYYIKGYVALWGLSMFFLALGYVALELMALNGARNLQKTLLYNIVKAPMRFFDTVPRGRILNRLAGDTNVLDEKMALISDAVLFCITYNVGAIIMSSIPTPIFIVPAVAMIVVYLCVQRFYVTSSRELQRLENISKSPILSHFSETLGGLSTVRAYKDQDRFQSRNFANIDTNNTAILYKYTCNYWMGIRLDSIGSFIVFAAAYCSITAGLLGFASPGVVAMSIVYAISMSLFISYMMFSISEMEMQFNAVERIQHFTNTPQEKSVHKEGNVSPGSSWPEKGEIEFRDVSLRYDTGLDPVIHDLNLIIPSGKKMGICGRTGSGKSSLTLGLFRLIDICTGEIRIDDIDISTVPLDLLRSRISIIPQDPSLFSGSVRFNLDPDNQSTDTDIWRSLEIAQLKHHVTNMPEKLDSQVSEGGENFSQGQRQLFCLARAFLRDSRILIMDEATASVDLHMDTVIQNVVETAFNEKTVITIAHRLSSILKYDSILVLQNGKVVETGPPKELMSKHNGVFASMVAHY